MFKNNFKNESAGLNLSKILFKISLVSLILSVFAQVYFTNNVAIRSGELTDLKTKRETLKKEIAALEYEDSLLSSLSYLEQKSSEMGFVKMTENVLAIKSSSTAAAVSIR